MNTLPTTVVAIADCIILGIAAMFGGLGILQRRAKRRVETANETIDMDTDPFALCEQDILDRPEREFPVLAEGEE